ncbi:hypothetical protein DKP78_21910, partial [Enterococcus faecium]
RGSIRPGHLRLALLSLCQQPQASSTIRRTMSDVQCPMTPHRDKGLGYGNNARVLEVKPSNYHNGRGLHTS